MQSTLVKNQLRAQLGDFSSIICLRAMMTGMEEALGPKATAIALTAAGRKRGKNLVQSLGLSGANASLEEIAAQLANALGENGTCLCLVHSITEDNGVISVYVSEDVCTSGEPQGSDRTSMFTLGAIWGALEEIRGQRLQGKHTESVLKGASQNRFEFTVMG